MFFTKPLSKPLKYRFMPVFRTREFDIRTLFEDGGVGAWFDANDTQTMFANSAGTTPATIGGLVALALDKSKNLTKGPELSQFGGNYSSADWTGGGGTVVDDTWSGMTQFSTRNYTRALVSGKTYSTEFIASKTGGLANFLLVAIGAGTVYASANTDASLLFRATSGTVGVIASGSGTNTHTMSAFSLKELLGNHILQVTSGSRAVLQRSSSGVAYLEDDTKVMQWTAPAGTYTVAYAGAAGGVILENQSLSGATDIMQSSKVAEYVAINRALGSVERRRLQDYLDRKGALL